jgi:hypothetical protein
MTECNFQIQYPTILAIVAFSKPPPERFNSVSCRAHGCVVWGTHPTLAAIRLGFHAAQYANAIAPYAGSRLASSCSTITQTQFSSFSPGTLSNSRRLLLTSGTLSASACAAIQRSLLPMGVPALCSAALTSP